MLIDIMPGVTVIFEELESPTYDRLQVLGETVIEKHALAKSAC